jgi:hypothetical protein
MKPRFRQMLLDNQELSMPEQKVMFNNTLEGWIKAESEGNEPLGQIDDVILMGVRI